MTTSTPPTDRWLEVHADALFRHAVTRLRRRSDAEDAVQETLLAALRSRGDFRGDSSERTWLIGILNHKIVDQIRAAERGEQAVGIDEAEEFFAPNGRWRKQPDEFVIDESTLIENEEFWQQVDSCLDGLPTRQARAFVLFHLQDEDSGETRKQLDVSSTNLWVLLHRARLRMRACLEKHWFHAGGDRS